MTEPELNAAIKGITRELDEVERSLRREYSTLQFVAVDRVVMLGKFSVGRMKSKTYAIRTANALNAYKPDERGK